EGEAKKPFRVAVAMTNVIPHSRKLTIAGRTEADKRVTVTARTGGVLTDLKVKRGMSVQKGEIIAVLSDEAREAQVAQAQAVVTVAERQLAGIKVDAVAEVRLVTGERASGKIRFVAKTASPTTRTYRVEVELPNADGKIPDGITAEVVVPLAPVLATRVPRSAVTFSSAGDLGLRVVDANDVV